MKGLVLKNQNGYFTVASGKNIIECRSRKRLKRSSAVLVGDYVELDDENRITGVLQRVSRLSRPPVANVDEILLVGSVREPSFQYDLMDKMAVLASSAHIHPLLCISKCDLDPSKGAEIASYYRKAGYEVFCLSKEDEAGINRLKEQIKGHIIAVSGPSGAGKSTLLNLLLGYHHFSSQSISAHSGRGKTTTRHAELIHWRGDQFIMDTPGFTLLTLPPIPPDRLDSCFPDFLPYLGHCRFADCRHMNEPDCAVKKAVEEGEIQKGRYDSYAAFMTELKESSNQF